MTTHGPGQRKPRMAHHETEWALQKRLTTDWLSDRTVVLNDEPLFLAAWEVMTTYRINSPRHWSEPSIDFLFLDHTGRMVALELKRNVRTPREGWSVLCQVTHRAHVLTAGYEQAGLRRRTSTVTPESMDARRLRPQSATLPTRTLALSVKLP